MGTGTRPVADTILRSRKPGPFSTLFSASLPSSSTPEWTSPWTTKYFWIAGKKSSQIPSRIYFFSPWLTTFPNPYTTCHLILIRQINPREFCLTSIARSVKICGNGQTPRSVLIPSIWWPFHLTCATIGLGIPPFLFSVPVSTISRH